MFAKLVTLLKNPFTLLGIVLIVPFVLDYAIRAQRGEKNSTLGRFTGPNPWPSTVRDDTTFTYTLYRHKSLDKFAWAKAEEIDKEYSGVKLTFTLNPSDTAAFRGPNEATTSAKGEAKVTVYGVRDGQSSLHVHSDGVSDIPKGRNHPFDDDSRPFETVEKP